MSHVNIFRTMRKLKMATKDEIIIDIAIRQNVRFNELANLVDRVCAALDESIRDGFLCLRQGKYSFNYTLDAGLTALRQNSRHL